MLFSYVQNYWFLSVGENHSHSNAGCMAGERSGELGRCFLVFGAGSPMYLARLRSYSGKCFGK